MPQYHEIQHGTQTFFVEDPAPLLQANADPRCTEFYVLTGRVVDIDDTFVVQGDRREWEAELQARCRKAAQARP